MNPNEELQTNGAKDVQFRVDFQFIDATGQVLKAHTLNIYDEAKLYLLQCDTKIDCESPPLLETVSEHHQVLVVEVPIFQGNISVDSCWAGDDVEVLQQKIAQASTTISVALVGTRLTFALHQQ